MIRTCVVVVLGFMMHGCGGGSSSGSIEAGISVQLKLQHQQSPQADGSLLPRPAGSKRFTNSEGVSITLNQAYLTLWSITLEDNCQDPTFVNSTPLDKLFSSAYAHADARPTRLSTPNIINLLTADTAVLALGTIAPPPGDYCGLTVEWLQADADTQYLPQDFDMVGRSVYLEGTYQVPTRNAVPFVIDTGRSLPEAKRRFPVRMSLSAEQRQAEVRLYLVYDHWFDAVDFTQLDQLSQQDLILNQVSQSVQLRGND